MPLSPLKKEKTKTFGLNVIFQIDPKFIFFISPKYTAHGGWDHVPDFKGLFLLAPLVFSGSLLQYSCLPRLDGTNQQGAHRRGDLWELDPLPGRGPSWPCPTFTLIVPSSSEPTIQSCKLWVQQGVPLGSKRHRP